MYSESPAPNGAPLPPGVGVEKSKLEDVSVLYRVLASVVIQVLKWATDVGRSNTSQFDGSLALGKTHDLALTLGCLECSFPGGARGCLQREGHVGNIRMFTLLSF